MGTFFRLYRHNIQLGTPQWPIPMKARSICFFLAFARPQRRNTNSVSILKEEKLSSLHTFNFCYCEPLRIQRGWELRHTSTSLFTSPCYLAMTVKVRIPWVVLKLKVEIQTRLTLSEKENLRKSNWDKNRVSWNDKGFFPSQFFWGRGREVSLFEIGSYPLAQVAF